jgi:hypothetical protein
MFQEDNMTLSGKTPDDSLEERYKPGDKIMVRLQRGSAPVVATILVVGSKKPHQNFIVQLAGDERLPVSWSQIV